MVISANDKLIHPNPVSLRSEVNYFFNVLNSPNKGIRDNAVLNISILVKANDKDVRVRLLDLLVKGNDGAVEVVNSIGEEANSYVWHLISKLNQPLVQGKNPILDSLVKIAEKNPDLVKYYCAYAIQNFNDPYIRGNCGELLGSINHTPITSLGILEKMLSDNQPYVRSSAVGALKGVIKAAKQQGLENNIGKIIPQKLTDLLEDQYIQIKAGAASVIGYLGRNGLVAVPSLIKFLSERNRFLAPYGSFALRQLGKREPDIVTAQIRRRIAGLDSVGTAWANKTIKAIQESKVKN